MSSLLDRIVADRAALHRKGLTEGDAVAKDHATVLATLIGEIQTKQRRADAPEVWGDADTVGAVKAAIDSAKQTAEMAAKGGRAEAAAKAKAEAAMLSGYMPQQMTEVEIEAFARAKFDGGMTKMGDVMGALRAERGGQYDGKLASTVVKRVIG